MERLTWGDLQKGEKFTEWLTNLQGYRDLHKKKLTGGEKLTRGRDLKAGRKTWRVVERITGALSLTGGEEAYRVRG